MGLAETIEHMNKDEEKKKNERRYSESLIPPDRFSHAEFKEYDYGICKTTDDIYIYRILKPVNNYLDEKDLSLIREAISLIKEDKWKVTSPGFSKDHLKIGLYDHSYYEVKMNCKVKGFDNDPVLLKIDGIYNSSNRCQKKFLKPIHKQEDEILENGVKRYMDNITALLVGSQRFVENGFILFDDGMLFSWDFNPIRYNMDSKSLENDLAVFIKKINEA